MHAREIQLFNGVNLVGQLCRRGGIGNLCDLLFPGHIVQQQAAVFIIDGKAQAGFGCACGHAVLQHVHRAEGQGFAVEQVFAHAERHARIVVNAGCIDGESGAVIFFLQIQHHVGAGIFYIACRLVGHEILGEGLLLVGHEPGEVRLVIAEHAGHQLDIRAVFVGQVSVPCPAKVAVAPCPLLFARRDMVIGDMQNAGVYAVIIAADKVVIAVRAHIAGGHGDIFVAGDIDAGAVVVLVIYARGDGERGNIALAVIEDGGHIRREDALGIVVHRNGRIGPPQEGLREIGAVIELAPDLDIGLIGIEGEGHFALGTVHLIDLGELHAGASVLIPGDAPVGGAVGGRAVMLGPVELDAAGDPRAGEAHQRRLDHLVVVDEVVAVGFIHGALNAAAQLGQHHDFQIIVFQPYGGVGLKRLFIEDLVHHGQRIHLAAGTLIDALFQKHGIFVGLADAVGRQINGLGADRCRALDVLHAIYLLIAQGTDTKI